MFKKIVKTFSSSLKINKVRLLLPSYWFKVENLMMLWAQLGANYNNGKTPNPSEDLNRAWTKTL